MNRKLPMPAPQAKRDRSDMPLFIYIVREDIAELKSFFNISFSPLGRTAFGII